MSRLLDEAPLAIRGSASPLAFERVAPEHYIEKDGRTLTFRSAAAERYLALDGKRAYDLGSDCDTCPFLFQRPGRRCPDPERAQPVIDLARRGRWTGCDA